MSGRPEVRIARVISRLNIGGPAIQAITLTKRLEERGYETRLFRGTEHPQEGTMDDLARELGVKPVHIASMEREVGARDALALSQLVAEFRRFRPHLVHTHAAKAGTLGRIAALSAFPRRPPLLVHTFHGQSLTGYFSARRAKLFGRVEHALAERTDAIIAISSEVRDDLDRLGVAPAERVEIVPLGFDLGPFQAPPSERAARRWAWRQRHAIAGDARLVTLIARNVPIKRVDRFLRIAGALEDVPGVRFAVVGDGELREELETSPEARKLAERVVWTGFERDVPAVCFASDVVALTSDNEGTPVSLIEAQAAGVPVVATRVGGTSAVVLDGETGFLADPENEDRFAAGVRELLASPERAQAMGAAGAERMRATFTLDRLVDDLDELYRRLLSRRQ